MQIVMLYRGDSPHPAHQGFAEAIDADTYRIDQASMGVPAGSIPAEVLNGINIDKYDIYIAEGTRSLYGALANQIVRDSNLIYLAADTSIDEIRRREPMDQAVINRMISNYGVGMMERIFDRYIDGVIAVSELVAESVRTLVDAPVRIAHPYIDPNMYEQLGNLSPSLKKKSAVTVGTYSWYKGQDILSDVWSQVRNVHPTAELYLVGDGYPEALNNEPGITACGYVEDLPKKLAESALHLHAARMDAFPVSVLEALRLGLPSIVTERTGDRSVVQEISEDMVVERSVKPFADAITEYFDMPEHERERLSRISESKGRTFDHMSRKEKFRREFESLISELK